MRTLGYKDNPKPANSQGAAFSFLILFMLVIGVAFIYLRFIKAYPTYIGGFNWLDEKITIQAGDQRVNVEPNDMFKLKIQKRGEAVVSIEDSSGKSIRENKYKVGAKRGLILELISSYEERQCIAEADVSNVYYSISDDNYINNISVIRDKPAESYFYDIAGLDTEYFVYPGSYSREFLPEGISEAQKVRGIFFVDCLNIENDAELMSDILGSIYYGEE